MGAQAKPFTTLFWNIWVESQIAQTKLHVLEARLDEIIATHNPDAFGFNEVLADKNGQSPLLARFEKMGYHTFFAPFSPERNGQFSGSALISRAKPAHISHHELGPDKYGAVRGFPGHTVKLIQAKLPHDGRQINMVVNYLAHLVPWNWAAHSIHHQAFRKLMKAAELQTATIIGGDFNRFKFMPHLGGGKSLYNRATGSILHPTWKLLGKIPIIQANYDNIFWTKCGTFKLDEFHILDRYPSDHTPLLAKFTLQ